MCPYLYCSSETYFLIGTGKLNSSFPFSLFLNMKLTVVDGLKNISISFSLSSITGTRFITACLRNFNLSCPFLRLSYDLPNCILPSAMCSVFLKHRKSK